MLENGQDEGQGDFDLADVNWEYHTASTNRSKRSLKHLVDNFFVQVLRQ